MKKDIYLAPSKITQKYDISSRTLVNLADSGKIRFIRPNENGRRVYHSEDIRAYFEGNIPRKKKVCYARINSCITEDFLENQVSLLTEQFPDTEIIKDIDSGINLKRTGFNKILDYIDNNEIDEIIVCSKDRICIIGCELFEWILEKNNIKLTVLNDSFIKEPEKQKELSCDLFTVTKVLLKIK